MMFFKGAGMSEGKSDFLESRPQRLCHMCGRCCRVSTTYIPYEELKSLAEQGDKGAIDFLEIFEPYESVEAARAVDKSTVDNILKAVNEDGILKEKDITFYKCRYILDDNLCGIYENRKELCSRCPSSPWCVVPPGCGFEGWLFQKREEIKQKIRKQKENLLLAQTYLHEAVTPEQIARINLTIDNIKKTIRAYEKYGSHNW